MTGQVRARDVLVLRSRWPSYRALCLRPRCPRPLGARFPDYAGAKGDKADHLHWHGNQALQDLHERARQHVARLTLLQGRRGTRSTKTPGRSPP